MRQLLLSLLLAFGMIVAGSPAVAAGTNLPFPPPAADAFNYDAHADVGLVRADVSPTTQDAPNTAGATGTRAAQGAAHAYDSLADLVAPNGLADDLLGAACSFSGETQVLMADGTTKPISEIKIGEWVLAQNPETGERGARQVTHLWVHEDTIVDLEIEGHGVATTEDHPFWNATDTEWQRADAIDPGDLVLTADGTTLTVDGMDWASARTTLAYNLTVDEIHTYFVEVGGDEALVHNTNGCNLWKLTREGAESTRRHSRFGTFYETVNRHGDWMWLTTDTAQHGGSHFKMYEETSTGLRWVAGLDEFGTKIADKHKSDVGAFIPWKELSR